MHTHRYIHNDTDTHTTVPVFDSDIRGNIFLHRVIHKEKKNTDTDSHIGAHTDTDIQTHIDTHTNLHTHSHTHAHSHNLLRTAMNVCDHDPLIGTIHFIPYYTY